MALLDQTWMYCESRIFPTRGPNQKTSNTPRVSMSRISDPAAPLRATHSRPLPCNAFIEQQPVPDESYRLVRDINGAPSIADFVQLLMDISERRAASINESSGPSKVVLKSHLNQSPRPGTQRHSGVVDNPNKPLSSKNSPTGNMCPSGNFTHVRKTGLRSGQGRRRWRLRW